MISNHLLYRNLVWECKEAYSFVEPVNNPMVALKGLAITTLIVTKIQYIASDCVLVPEKYIF